MTGTIRVGIGGWDFAPWQKTFYPPDLPKARALEYASRRLTMVEVNATFYRTQTSATFKRWHDTAPDGFVFALKAPRGASFRREADEAAPAVMRFLESGIVELGPKLGPILWQLPPARRFDADAIARFLALLPPMRDGLQMRHVIEAQHASFSDPAFVALLREHGVARALIDSEKHALSGDLTAPFVYARLERNADLPDGYEPAMLDAWTDRFRRWAAGKPVAELPTLHTATAPGKRDGYVLCIGGDKAFAPRAAMSLQSRLGLAPAGINAPG